MADHVLQTSNISQVTAPQATGFGIKILYSLEDRGLSDPHTE